MSSSFLIAACMIENERKPIKIVNKTTYFAPWKDRTHVTISSPYSYKFKRIKIQGYETRLYWQFRYCQDKGGQTFFYTLTYNDAHVPFHYDHVCFDYKDLVYLLNGGFKKILLRKYGTLLKYFVSAELGDGKGKRGFHNNPHYHCLFFLEPANDSRYHYVKITPLEFRHLVRSYWQGFDECECFMPYSVAKYGIAKEGDNCGLVTDYRAVCYCAKYVCKDTQVKNNERHVLRLLESKFSYLLDVNNDDILCGFNEEILSVKLGYLIPYTEKYHIKKIVDDNDLNDELKQYAYGRYEREVKQAFNEYRNRYSNKCRISNGVGDYALDFVERYDNPVITVPDKKKGWKCVPIDLYYYRKLFTKVEKNAVGNPIRVITELGLEYKSSKLNQRIADLKKKTADNLSVIDRPLFYRFLSSNFGKYNFGYDEFVKQFTSLSDVDRDLILTRYAEYKLVYEDRFFEIRSGRYDGPFDFPRLDALRDFRRFQRPSFYQVRYDSYGVLDFLSSSCEGYLSYSSHPYFLQFLGLFDLFDAISDYFFVSVDERMEKEASEVSETRRFHKAKQFNSTYKLAS